MNEELDKIKEIERIGDALTILYSKCWNTAYDCYQRYFQSKEINDRTAVVEMTNFLFGSCCEALEEQENDFKSE